MRLSLFAVFLVCLSEFCNCSHRFSKWNSNKRSRSGKNHLLSRKLHQLLDLNERASKRLADLNDYTRFYNEFLKHILRVRVPGTVGHREVREFILTKLKEFKWDVKIDEFDDETPLGLKRFTNIVATLNPEAKQRLTLAAHYDSKLVKPVDGKYFVAATDSAVPCAMLLDIAQVAKGLVTEKLKGRGVGIQLIFLDGEEAFVEWTKTDSIYGARHLADLFEKTPHHGTQNPSDTTMLQAMDAFVLLDLIGAKKPQFLNNFDNTTCLYTSLQHIESDLNNHNLLSPYETTYFPGKPSYPVYVEDDHLPFLRKGVPILHLISVPFPDVWHTVGDDESCLDQPTIENLLKIFRVFVAEYLHFDTFRCEGL